MDLGALGKLLLVMAGVLALAGVALLVLARFPNLPLGKLPGDIAIHRGNFRFYFPLATCILLSVVLTLLFRLFTRR